MKLDEIYNENYKKIYLFLKKRLWKYINEEDINIIINKSFNEYFKKKETLYDDCKIENYIKGIAFNIMRNLFTYKARYYHKNIELLDYHYSLKRDNDLLEIIIRKEQNQKLYDSLSILNYKEKKVILLYYFYNYRYKEIKHIMHISTSTIYRLKKSGLKKLKNYLDKLDYVFEI